MHSNRLGSSASLARRVVPTVAALLVVALTASLGTWQLRRADEKRALQARADAAAHAAPVSIPGVPVAPEDLDGRRVAVRGRLLPQHSVFIDNRTRHGVAGFHVATPVRLEGSALNVLVLRGWVARDPRERTHLPAVPAPSGTVVLEGIAEASIPQTMELARAAAPGPDERIWQNLSFDGFERWSGLKLQHVLVRQLGEPVVDDGLARDWIAAGGDVGKHLGYAFQWFAMAAITLGLWVWFTFLKRRDAPHDDR